MWNINRSPQSMVDWVHGREHPERAERVKVRMPVDLELSPNSLVRAIIDDLSRDGFRLRSRAILHEGQSLKMHLPRATVTCELRWVDGLQAGGVFIEAPDAPSW
jgi:hypothetical protein